jgi:hypothetical protein
MSVKVSHIDKKCPYIEKMNHCVFGVKKSITFGTVEKIIYLSTSY